MCFLEKENECTLIVNCLLHLENLEAKDIQEDLAKLSTRLYLLSIVSNPVLCAPVYFDRCGAKRGQNTMGFCSISTYVGYHEEKFWREWHTYAMK